MTKPFENPMRESREHRRTVTHVSLILNAVFGMRHLLPPQRLLSLGQPWWSLRITSANGFCGWCAGKLNISVRPRPRGQARGQKPAREDAGAPLRRYWLHLILKDHQGRPRLNSRCGGRESPFQKLPLKVSELWVTVRRTPNYNPIWGSSIV